MNKVNVAKIVFSIVSIVVFVALLIYLAPVMKDIFTKEGQIAFRDKIDESGFGGFLILLGLQIAQIALVILPGEPLEILAGMCYGPIWGTIFVMISSTIMTLIIFWLVNKYGRKLVYQMFKKEKVDKVINSPIYKNPQRIEFIMLLLFLIPGTPKDLLVYLAGLLPIRFGRFIMISSIARIPSVISSTISGNVIASGDWKISIIIYAVTYLIVGLLIFILNQKDKGRMMKVAMRNLK